MKFIFSNKNLNLQFQVAEYYINLTTNHYKKYKFVELTLIVINAQA